jgi:hypothetical protein
VTTTVWVLGDRIDRQLGGPADAVPLRPVMLVVLARLDAGAL